MRHACGQSGWHQEGSISSESRGHDDETADGLATGEHQQHQEAGPDGDQPAQETNASTSRARRESMEPVRPRAILRREYDQKARGRQNTSAAQGDEADRDDDFGHGGPLSPA